MAETKKPGGVSLEELEKLRKMTSTPSFFKEETKSESDQVLARTQEILREYEQESNIPLDHEYWTLMNRFRFLQK